MLRVRAPLASLRSKSHGLASLALATLLLGGAPAFAVQPGSPTRFGIGGGIVEGRLPGVGRIIGEVTGGETVCTGTLIRPDVVLTAAHCVQKPSSLRFEITAADDGTTTVHRAGIRVALAHPEFTPIETGSSQHDIGVLILDEPVPEHVAAPVPWLRTATLEENEISSVLTIGYGFTPDGSVGTKYSVRMKLTAIEALTYSAAPLNFGNGGQVVEGVCKGDSGGPDLATLEGVDTVIGVHSYAFSVCPSPVTSMRTDAYASAFIEPILAGQVPAGCSGESLEAAVCHAELETSGCGCIAGHSGPGALLSLVLTVLGVSRGQRRRPTA